MSVISIGIPRVINYDKYTRLEADVTWQQEEETIQETIFYEVNIRWGEYLAAELSDPFVLAMTELAIENGYDIEFKAPMTEDLKYQLETYFIPVYAKKAPKKSDLKAFNLIGETTANHIESLNAVGTGFSAGVDSYYTVLKHIKSQYDTKKITHLLLAVNGAANTGINATLDKKWFDEEMRRFSPLAEEMNLELIGVNSNSSLINRYRKKIKGGSVVSTAGFVHALRKLFGTFYWASGYEADIVKFSTDDPCFLEPFSTPLLSVEGLRFYLSGTEASRLEKLEYIADNPIVQKSLTVCGSPDSCGICCKCTRTMVELYLIGKLDKFSEVFPNTKIDKRAFSKLLARELAQDHAPFTTDIIKRMQRERIRMPLTVYLWKWCYYTPLLALKKRLRTNRYISYLYYEKGWIERLGGHRPPEEIVQARLTGERSEK